MQKAVEHGYYTHNELGQFHSFNDEPAIVINSYINIKEDGDIEEIEGYKARYENGVWLKTERNDGDIFISNEIVDGD